MKTLQTRPRFQAATRHYHRHREDNRGWDDWVDGARKPGTSRRRIWIAASVVVLMSAAVMALFGFNLL